MTTIGEALQRGESLLAATSSSARLDAEVLLAHSLRLSRTGLIVRLREKCPGDAAALFSEYVSRRKLGEPVGYIIGEREFYGRRFAVSPAVLIPRPESELIIDEALAVTEEQQEVSLLDLGTGSGCLAISLVLELKARGKRVRCAAIDSSIQALEVARRNAHDLDASADISFVESDWFSRRDVLLPPYDLIVANPPYVDPAEPAQLELSFEPQGALYSGDQGLHDARRIMEEAPAFLRPGGVLLCEVGAGKRARLKDAAAVATSCEYTLLGDDSLLDRFTVVKLVKR